MTFSVIGTDRVMDSGKRQTDRKPDILVPVLLEPTRSEEKD